MSYVSQQFLIEDATTLANFKVTGLALSTAMSSSGWVQTSDTGQVNWGSIAVVPSSGSPAYEIWKPADALQTGSTQYFLRITYAKSGNATAGMYITVAVGTSTDGAGNLTGTTTAVHDLMGNNCPGAGSVATYDCYFSGDIDRFGCLFYRSSNSNQITGGFSVERTKNTDGTNSSDGVCITSFGCSSLGGAGGEIIVFGIGLVNRAKANWFIWFCFNDTINSSTSFNNNVAVSPMVPQYGKFGNPLTGLCVIHNADMTEGGIFTCSLYGATRTYMATSQQQAQGLLSNNKLGIRFD